MSGGNSFSSVQPIKTNGLIIYEDEGCADIHKGSELPERCLWKEHSQAQDWLPYPLGLKVSLGGVVLFMIYNWCRRCLDFYFTELWTYRRAPENVERGAFQCQKLVGLNLVSIAPVKVLTHPTHVDDLHRETFTDWKSISHKQQGEFHTSNTAHASAFLTTGHWLLMHIYIYFALLFFPSNCKQYYIHRCLCPLDNTTKTPRMTEHRIKKTSWSVWPFFLFDDIDCNLRVISFYCNSMLKKKGKEFPTQEYHTIALSIL